VTPVRSQVAPTPFADVSALRALGEQRFAGTLHPGWTIGGKPNGGYLLAMLGRAASNVSVHPHVVAASAHYLRPPEPGPVVVEAEVLRAGRSASQVRARMVQGATLCVEGLLTTAVLSGDERPYWSDGLPEVGSVPFDRCLRIPPLLSGGVPVAIFDEVDFRLEPASSGFSRGEPAGRGELRGWLALPAGERFDPTSLLYAVDSFPPATLDIEPSGWVPTLELTVYVRAMPVAGPVRVLQRAHLIQGRRVDEACFVWDAHGTLVAQGTQLAAIRLG
jgi:Thioesterase-like superfamily